jgi:mutator protein MutT
MITVVAAIIRRNDRILITQRSSDVHLAGLWEFPGGKVEPAESLDDALRREILEELGIRIRVENEFFTTEHHYPERSVRLHFFNCFIIEGEPRALEVADLRWISPSDLDELEFPEADKELIELLRA